jgi:hypothetical protein
MVGVCSSFVASPVFMYSSHDLQPHRERERASEPERERETEEGRARARERE